MDACGFPYKNGAGLAERSSGLHNVYSLVGFGIGVWRYIVLYSSIHMLIFSRLRYGILLSTTGKWVPKRGVEIYWEEMLYNKTSGAESVYCCVNALDHVAHP